MKGQRLFDILKTKKNNFNTVDQEYKICLNCQGSDFF